jgi:hypothetical protein
MGDYYEHWNDASQVDTRGEYYVENAVAHIKGEENLKSWQLREGSPMRMLICDICKYVMVCSHELYNGNIVLVYSKTTECEKIPIGIRGFTQSWPCPANRSADFKVPGPDRPIPALPNKDICEINGGTCNMMKVFWKQSLLSCYNRQPFKETGDRDIRDLFEKECSVAGIKPMEVVSMDHKNLGKLSENVGLATLLPGQTADNKV